MAKIRLQQDFKEFLRLLIASEVRFLLVGGYAVALHGYLRGTGDLDLWVKPDEVTAKELTECFVSFGLPRATFHSESFKIPNKIFRLGFPPVRIEILTGVAGVEFDECWRRREMREVGDLILPVISRQDLIVNKRAAGRFKDLDDLRHLGADDENDKD